MYPLYTNSKRICWIEEANGPDRHSMVGDAKALRRGSTQLHLCPINFRYDRN